MPAEELTGLFDPDRMLEDVFLSAFKDARSQTKAREDVPPFEARFYPYAGLSSTIRLRQGRVYVRVSDVLADSPREILYSLARILIAKLYRRKMPDQYLQVYRRYSNSSAIQNATNETRRNRGYKIMSGARGKVHDLDEVFELLNAKYFQSTLERPQLSWSVKKAHRVLGHHDHVHEAIVVSQVLDSESVPRFVLEYVLYHEMLHVKHPARIVGGRTIVHGRLFREDERRFEKFAEAVKWLNAVSVPARRRRRKAPVRRAS